MSFREGGLACRAILETTPEHNVNTFISLSSPQGGQFGGKSDLSDLLPSYRLMLVPKFVYNSFSICLSDTIYLKYLPLKNYTKETMYL